LSNIGHKTIVDYNKTKQMQHHLASNCHWDEFCWRKIHTLFTFWRQSFSDWTSKCNLLV